jgi:hypothetical protein
MDLMLVPQEQEVLLWAVKGTISDLGTEIGHTDNQAMAVRFAEAKANSLRDSCSARVAGVRAPVFLCTSGQRQEKATAVG